MSSTRFHNVVFTMYLTYWRTDVGPLVSKLHSEYSFISNILFKHREEKVILETCVQ